MDLTYANENMWHRWLHLKLLRTIPDRHMVGFIMEMLSNRSFVVHTSDGQRSRLRRMKNGVPQGSVLSTMLFNINISDLPETTSGKYVMPMTWQSYSDVHIGRKLRRNGFQVNSPTLSYPLRPSTLTPLFPYILYTCFYFFLSVSFLVLVHWSFFLARALLSNSLLARTITLFSVMLFVTGVTF